jgi:hypothetical protein
MTSPLAAPELRALIGRPTPEGDWEYVLTTGSIAWVAEWPVILTYTPWPEVS